MSRRYPADMQIQGDPLAGLRNWAGNHAYVAAGLLEPESIDELQAIVRDAPSLRVLGSRHSFNDIADTTGDLVSLGRMPRRSSSWTRRPATVTVDGGVRYGDLARRLMRPGSPCTTSPRCRTSPWPAPCATATHGSGDRSGNLATAVARSRWSPRTAKSSSSTLERDPGDVQRRRRRARRAGGRHVADPGAAAGLPDAPGRLRGPAAERRGRPLRGDRRERGQRQPVQRLARALLRASLAQASGPRRRRHAPPPECSARPGATVPIHPIKRMPADACTEQLGVVGPWHARMPHFRMDHTPSAGDELQSEYLIPRQHAVEALLAIDAIREPVRGVAPGLRGPNDRGRPAVDEHGLRSPVGGDPLHLATRRGRRAASPAGDRGRPGPLRAPSALGQGIHDAGRRGPILATRSSRSSAALLQRHDPNGKFRNAFLSRYVFGD